MINTYIVPVSDGNNVWIETVKAKNYNDSLEKFIEYFSHKFEQKIISMIGKIFKMNCLIEILFLVK